MATSEQLHGLWWTPEEPDHKVAGVLTLSDTAEPLLVAHDALFTDFRNQKQPGTIYGASGGRAVSIFDAFAVEEQVTVRNGAKFSTQRIETATGVIVGDTHIRSAEELAFTHAAIEIDLLTVWAGQAQLDIELPYENHTGAYTLTVPVVPPTTVQYGEVQLTISTDPHVTLGGRYSLSNMSIPMDVRTVFLVTSDIPLPASTFIELSRRLADLITLAMFRPSDVRKITFRRTVEPTDVRAFDWWGTGPAVADIEVDYKARTTVNFTLPEVDPVILFKGWHELHHVANYGMLSLIAMLRETTTYYESKLFAACGTIEALHKGLHPIPKSKPAPSYRTRCEELAAIPPAGVVAELIPDISTWAGYIVRARNHLAHGDEPSARKVPENEWFALYEPTVALLVLVVMTHLGIPEEVQLRTLHRGALRRAVTIGAHAQ